MKRINDKILLDDTVHFVGSIAAIFREELEETAGIYGIRIGNILREPIGRMVAYHQQKLKNETD